MTTVLDRLRAEGGRQPANRQERRQAAREIDAIFSTAYANGRTCAGCDLCCTVLAVDVIDKPFNTPCQHLSGPPGESCSIYHSRPLDCRAYACMWRMSATLLADEMQPAASGIVVNMDVKDHRGLTITIGADPARPDAWKAPAVLALMGRIAAAWNCIVVVGFTFDATHIMTPVGRLFSREEMPAWFQDTGGFGVPTIYFLDNQPKGDPENAMRWNQARNGKGRL